METHKNLIDWSQKVCLLDLPDLNKDTEIWIAEPKNIKKEWRLFVVDNEIISTSRYMNEGLLDESDDDLPDNMIKFAQGCIAAYRLADIYVMDIAQTDPGYKLIECNCFNGTGFYKHDVEKIIRSVTDFVKRQRLA